MNFFDTYYTKWLLYYQASSSSSLGQCMNYDWQALAMKHSHSTQDVLVQMLLWLLFIYSEHGKYSQATPRLLKACVTSWTSLLTGTVCKYKFNHPYPYLHVHVLGLLEDLLVQQRALFDIMYKACGCLHCDSIL